MMSLDNLPLSVDAGKVVPGHLLGYFTWTINDFFSYCQFRNRCWIGSTNFCTLGSEWYLDIYPRFDIDGIPHTALRLVNYESPPARSLSYIIGIQGRGGVELMVRKGERDFSNGDNSVWHFIKPPLSMQHRDLVAPGGTVTVFCRIQERNAPCPAEESQGECHFSLVEQAKEPQDECQFSHVEHVKEAKDVGMKKLNGSQTDETFGIKLLILLGIIKIANKRWNPPLQYLIWFFVFIFTIICILSFKAAKENFGSSEYESHEDVEITHTVAVSCSEEPPLIENGYPVVSKRTHGHVIYYECNKFYEKNETEHVECLYGKWTGPTPICIDGRCYTDHLNFSGLVKPNMEFLVHQQYFTLSCEKGYKIMGQSKKIYCNMGKWKIDDYPCIKDNVTETVEENFRNSEVRSHEEEETSYMVKLTTCIWCFASAIILSSIFNFPDLISKALKKNFNILEETFDNVETLNNVLGKDVATDTAEDFINSEDRSLDGQETSHGLSGTWQTRISQMYDTKEGADVRFIVNKSEFEAHRFILATRSSVFCRLLTGGNTAYDTHIVDAGNITEAAFDILLRFLYKDTLETSDKKLIIEVYRCARTYHVQDLQNKCEEKMNSWGITADEMFNLLDSGLDVPVLRNKCMDLLRREGTAALSTPTLLQISFKTLSFLLESGVLENVPAMKRIEHIMQWFAHANTEESDYTDARNELLGNSTNPLLGRLGFGNLELNELAHVVKNYRGLITPEELVSFLEYNHTQNESLLPDWYLPVSSK